MNKKPVESLRYATPRCYNCIHYGFELGVIITDAAYPFGTYRDVAVCRKHDFAFDGTEEPKHLVCDAHSPKPLRSIEHWKRVVADDKARLHLVTIANTSEG